MPELVSLDPGPEAPLPPMHSWAHRWAQRAATTITRAWFAPLLIGNLCAAKSRDRIVKDLERWQAVTQLERPSLLGFLAGYPEFRTLYYYRLRRGGILSAMLAACFKLMYPGERTLHLTCSDIGGGLFIQHGFATVVAARKVGENCWINQQVTIGFDRPGARPVLGNNVSVHAGAKVLGAIVLGDGARVGANAVVLCDVAAGHTAVGVPARVLAPKPDRR